MAEQVDISKLELASTKTRFKAFFIDDMFITILVFAILWNDIAATGSDFAIAILMLIAQYSVHIMVLKFIYQTFFVWYYGQTLGKMVAKVRVIDYDNFGRVSLVQSAIRSATRLVSESFMYAGFLLAYFQESKQTLHDKFGKTLVVNV